MARGGLDDLRQPGVHITRARSGNIHGQTVPVGHNGESAQSPNYPVQAPRSGHLALERHPGHRRQQEDRGQVAERHHRPPRPVAGSTNHRRERAARHRRPTDADQGFRRPPTIRKAGADTGCKNAVVEHGEALGIDVEIIRRTPATRGFAVRLRRRVVERAPSRLTNHRRLARDYEALPTRSEAMIHLVVIKLTPRRLTGEATPTRRGTCPSKPGRRGFARYMPPGRRLSCSAPEQPPETGQGPDPISRTRPLTCCSFSRGGGI
ncbi:hypothetical protein EYS09_15725 [Streptomyces kasugaensis]|uniref:Transposase DDE domain-containing protein n=1 Tax=Streptomyces kasugaensis TaxID=1946 RepID=A0A4Q9HUJ7_STRKA|nr:hypothetical protein EYS09_15725 [Streptomyces kasugaensis]